MNYSDIIDREKQKRAMLVRRLDEVDRRISTLERMSYESDPLDAWLDEQTTPTAAEPMRPVASAEVPSSTVRNGVPKKISAQWVALIEFLGLEPKPFSEVAAFNASRGATMTSGAARTGLMTYRKDYGLFANPKPGFYAATQKGMDFAAQYRAKERESL